MLFSGILYATTLKAYFLNVGQGDSTLITVSTGEVVLIDSGPNENFILNTLQELRISHIDLLLASHPHTDHITGMDKIINKYKPQKAGIELLLFNNNAKTAMIVGEARGVILLELQLANLEITQLTPPQVKSSVTGNGRADKKQVQENVKRICKLEELPKPDDAADAAGPAGRPGRRRGRRPSAERRSRSARPWVGRRGFVHQGAGREWLPRKRFGFASDG